MELEGRAPAPAPVVSAETTHKTFGPTEHRIKDGRQECTSVINLSFNRMEVKRFAYYPKYQTVELFGYIGGYLGVSLGISLLAVSDLLETLLLIFRAIRAAFKKRRIKKQDMIQRMHSCYHADSRGNFSSNLDHQVAFMEYSLCKSVKLAVKARESLSVRLSSLIMLFQKKRSSCIGKTVSSERQQPLRGSTGISSFKVCAKRPNIEDWFEEKDHEI
ncbi:hypothetical protein TNCV_4965341 [Trichonephila clavipes]|nr:hypothetical protein TNCV_4965341 [Trichonephila clavipes]